MNRMRNNAFMAEHARWQAQSAAIDTLLDAWAKEIERGTERLKEEAKEIARLKDQQAIEAGREQARIAQETQNANAYAAYLSGLAITAQDNDSVTVPTGFRVASGVVSGPPIAELIADVSAEIQDGDDTHDLRARQSIQFALGHGLMPHPSDLSEVLEARGIDADWAAKFQDLGQALDALDTNAFKNAQLKGVVGHNRIDVLSQHVKLLAAYSPDRILTITTKPDALKATPAPTLPSLQAPRGGKMEPAAFSKMMDGLFS